MKIKKFTLFAVSAVLMLATFISCGNKSKNEPENDGPAGTVKDICGNTYNYVKIGTQYWLAENMRCDKYDTKSELQVLHYQHQKVQLTHHIIQMAGMPLHHIVII